MSYLPKTCYLAALVIWIGCFGCDGCKRQDTLRVPESHFVKGPGQKKLIVFVHGVIGDMDNTWVNADTHVSWPYMVSRDGELSDYDVFVYGYYSPKFGRASNITQIATQMSSEFLDDYYPRYDEIYFITHSMGGLITKRFLNTLNTRTNYPMLQKTRLVLFISVPSAGAGIAALSSWISANPQFNDMGPRSGASFLQSIDGDWQSLLNARNPANPFPRTYSAYETQSVGPYQVVPELYISHLSDDTPVPFDFNHIKIVKPESENNRVYRWAKNRLLMAAAYPVQPLSTSLKSGHVVLYDATTHYDMSGFSFAEAKVVAWDSGKADLLVSNTTPTRQPSAMFFTQDDTGHIYQNAPADIGANAGIIKMPAASINEVKEAPRDGYLSHWFQAEPNAVYCIRNRDGHHYAVIKVTDIQEDRIAFDWIYQPASSSTF